MAFYNFTKELSGEYSYNDYFEFKTNKLKKFLIFYKNLPMSFTKTLRSG